MTERIINPRMNFASSIDARIALTRKLDSKVFRFIVNTPFVNPSAILKYNDGAVDFIKYGDGLKDFILYK